VCLANGDFARYPGRATDNADWTQELIPAIGVPAADEERIYAALFDNSVRLFNQSNGHWRWVAVVPSRPAGGPVIVGSSIAVPLLTGDVVEVAAETGQLRPLVKPTSLASVVLRVTSVAASGGRIYLAGIATDESRTLFAWGLKPADAK
jgi:hypothetical protein